MTNEWNVPDIILTVVGLAISGLVGWYAGRRSLVEARHAMKRAAIDELHDLEGKVDRMLTGSLPHRWAGIEVEVSTSPIEVLDDPTRMALLAKDADGLQLPTIASISAHLHVLTALDVENISQLKAKVRAFKDAVHTIVMMQIRQQGSKDLVGALFEMEKLPEQAEALKAHVSMLRQRFEKDVA